MPTPKPLAFHVKYLILCVTIGAATRFASSTASRKAFEVQYPGVATRITVPQATYSLKRRPQVRRSTPLCPAGQRLCTRGRCCDAGDSCSENPGHGCCAFSILCPGKMCTHSCSIDNHCCHENAGGQLHPRDSLHTTRCGDDLTSSSSEQIPTSTPTPTSMPLQDIATSTFTSPTFSPTIPTLPTTTYSMIPAPEATDASFNTTISAVDPRIQYSNLEWGDTYTCNTTSKTCSEPAEYMLFQFVGTAIFMNLNMGLTGMIYSASVDGSSDIVDGFRSANSCGTGWSRFGLSNELHTVNITILGTSPQTPNSLLSEAAVDFSSFIVTSRPNGTSGGNPSRVSINSGISTSPTTKSNAEFWTSQLILAITCIASTTMVII